MQFMERPDLQRRLIAAGVSNLSEFGYDSVGKDNIMTDSVYSKFFRSMLEDNRGQDPAIDVEIDALIKEIDENLESA